MSLYSSKVKYFFTQLNSENIDIVEQFYASKTTFVDPLGTIQGVAALRDYYQNLYASVKEISFEFPSVVENGETVFAAWRMDMKVKKLNGGKSMVLEGCSRIHFDPETNLALFHQDYFDMNAFIYRYIPAVNLITSYVNKKLKK